MTSDRLVDQDARDTIVEQLDRTLFVEAGAGTGKTRSLVDRLVRLLATGRATATSVAAITFTEAAAAELRDRLRASIEALAALDAAPPEERARCEAALADLDSAAVETIHAFCRRLLAAYPLAAGLPPAFDLVTDTGADAALRERWDRWFADYLERAADDEVVGRPVLRALALGAGADTFFIVAQALHADWDRLNVDPAPVPQPEVDLDDMYAILDGLQTDLEQCRDPEDPMAKHLGGLPGRLRAVEQAGDDMALVRALTPLAYNASGSEWRLGRTGRAPNWPSRALSEIREECMVLHALARDALVAFGQAATAEISREITAFVLQAAEDRRREGQLEFQDLLVLTRQVLARQPEVRRAIRERYTHLLIDEFQDTDPLQAEIAFLLGTSEDGELEGDWSHLPLDEGRLFFVGDPKQSIYRFRRADIDVYRRIRDIFEASLLELTQNFRSVPAVLDWVNAQFVERFAPLDAADGAPNRQAPHVDLHAARPAIEANPTVYRIGEEFAGNAGRRREWEAEHIVALLRDVQAGSWLVYDRDRDMTRTATLQDVAILSRARTGFSALVPALEAAAIPHRVESRTLVYDAQEVRDFIAVLRAIDDPTDEIALVAALCSPAFACGDDDLVRFRDAGGRWDYRPAAPSALTADDPVVAAMRWLRDQHERRWWLPLPRLVDEVLAGRRFLELAFVDQRPRERWQRLRYVADQSRGYAERPEATLRGLVDWLEWQASENAQVQDRVVPEADDDAVRLMTTHSSKGLQFPIVVLVGLDSATAGRGRPVLWDDDGTPQVRLAGMVQTGGYEAALALSTQLDGFESERLLYVAKTRAQDHLVLSCFHAPPDQPRARRTTATELYEFAEEHPHLCRTLALPLDTPAPATAKPTEVAPPLEQPGDRERWIEARKALIAARRVRVSVSATTVARELAVAPMPEVDAGLEKEPAVDEEPPWRRGRAGTSIGRAVHSVLQTVDLATGADLEAIASAQATAEGVPDRVAEVTRLARAALESSAVREAVASGRFWREVYAATDVDGVIVDGFIDLLYESSDGYVVVDYKTDSIGKHDVDAILDRYRPQGETYALILQSQLTRPVVRCDFVFVSAPGGAVVRDVPVTAGGLDVLRARIGALV